MCLKVNKTNRLIYCIPQLCGKVNSTSITFLNAYFYEYISMLSRRYADIKEQSNLLIVISKRNVIYTALTIS